MASPIRAINQMQNTPPLSALEAIIAADQADSTTDTPVADQLTGLIQAYEAEMTAFRQETLPRLLADLHEEQAPDTFYEAAWLMDRRALQHTHD